MLKLEIKYDPYCFNFFDEIREKNLCSQSKLIITGDSYLRIEMHELKTPFDFLTGIMTVVDTEELKKLRPTLEKVLKCTELRQALSSFFYLIKNASKEESNSYIYSPTFSTDYLNKDIVNASFISRYIYGLTQAERKGFITNIAELTEASP